MECTNLYPIALVKNILLCNLDFECITEYEFSRGSQTPDKALGLQRKHRGLNHREMSQKAADHSVKIQLLHSLIVELNDQYCHEC